MIRNFVAPMIVGVIVGVYSSVFIAGPMLIYFKLRPEKAAMDKAESASAVAAKEA